MNSERIQQWGVIGGIASVIIMTIGLIITALAFVGLEGQTYSPFNHFVSELGHTQASELWFVFSVVLILGAIGFALHMLAVGNRFSGFWRWLFIIGGLIVGLFGGLVGVFPMDVNSRAHRLVALVFFVSSMGLVTAFTVYVLVSKQKVYPRWLALVGIPMIISAAIFLTTLFSALGENPEALDAPEGTRAAFDIIPTSEWGIIIFIMVWVIVVAIYHRAHPKLTVS